MPLTPLHGDGDDLGGKIGGKVWPTDGPTNQHLTWVCARDACASKNKIICLEKEINKWQMFVLVLVVEHCSVSKSCNFLIFWRIAVALRDFPTDRQITRHTRTNIYLFVSNSLQRAFLCVSICGFLAAERVSKWLTATLEFWTQRPTFEALGP